MLNEYATNKIVNFINSKDGQYCFDTANDFGVDPYLYIALMTGESSLDHEGTIPGGVNYNGYGVGISQLESPAGQKINAYNYTLNQNEFVYETMENAIDKKKNIKIGIMRFQNILQKYHNNIYLALQSYNYGEGLIDLIIAIYADEMNITINDVINNQTDIGWMKYVQEVYKNPNGFVQKENIDWSRYSNYSLTIDYLKKWEFETYGNDEYIASILNYYIGIYSKNMLNDNITYTNLVSMEQIINKNNDIQSIR